MDRFIRQQGHGSPNRGLYLAKGEAEISTEQDAFDTKAFMQTTRAARIAEEKPINQGWFVNPIGTNVVLVLLIAYTVYVAYISSVPLTGKTDFKPLRIDLQTSPAYKLELLPGIGPKMASRIIEYRKTHRLHTPDDLIGVHGIGKRKVDHLRWLIQKEELEK
ncbi:MAG TPA: helix-hairpin-helix domain-containing protein [Phycisphaerales bacterium]|nr:helix-hairpin-helix domain-containing protein [Phycisphaerales bacterium]